MSGLGGTESWRFRPDIEGLRAIAILGVILFHAGVPGVPGGFLGVDVFFVLSGFLITGILIDEVRRTGTISLSAFWARRARRLLPAATLVSLVTLIVLLRLDSPFAEQRYAGSAISFATYWSNLLFWRRGADYFDHSVATDPFLHTWSLAVEEQYYLLFAPCLLLLALVLRRKGAGAFPSWVARIALPVSLASLAGYLILAGSRPVFAFYVLPTRAWEFGVGSLLAVAASRGGEPGPLRRPELVAAGGLLAVVLAWFVSSGTGWSRLVTPLPVLGTAALIQVGTRGTSIVTRLLQTAPARWIGRLSYSWYLWHWPLAVYWTKLVPDNTVPLVVGMPLVSLGLAQLTYSVVEHPSRQARWLRPASRGLFAAVLLAAATIVTARWTRQRADHRLQGPAYAFILEARDARTRIYQDGCDRELTPLTQERCSYGVAGSDSIVVLFGDSHAAQWFPALEPLALRRGWRLVPLTRPGCPSLDIRIWSSMPNRTPAVCDRWRDAALRRIADLHPFLVVMSNYRGHSVLADSGSGHQSAEFRPELWERGLSQILTRLPESSAIVLLGDSPFPRSDVPTCLVEQLPAVARCDFSRATGVVTALTRVERAAAAADPRVTYADLTDLFCGPTVCRVVQGDTAMYSDNSHVSVSFAASLSPHLAPLLDGAVAHAREAVASPVAKRRAASTHPAVVP